MAPGPACAPPLSRCALRRALSEIRTVCSNERPYGSVRGVPGNRYPYRDRHLPQDVVSWAVSEDYPRTLLELERRFNREEACAEYLAALRWPGGWVCPRCAGAEAWPIRRNRWRCDQCRYERSVTAGTIFQDSHLPLTIWFRAMWQVTSQKNGSGFWAWAATKPLGRCSTNCVGPW